MDISYYNKMHRQKPDDSCLTFGVHFWQG